MMEPYVITICAEVYAADDEQARELADRLGRHVAVVDFTTRVRVEPPSLAHLPEART